MNIKKTTPGPGSYEKDLAYKTIGSGSKFTIPRDQHEKSSREETRPGPWSYNTI